MSDAISRFYRQHLPEAKLGNHVLLADCPFCSAGKTKAACRIQVVLHPESFFHGYFRTTSRCVPGGFPLHFARQAKVPLSQVPGFDPDREYYGHEVDYPVRNLNQELPGFVDKLTDEQTASFLAAGVGMDLLQEMQVGFNGRYLVYPYLQPDGNCYSARCIHPDRPEDAFWHGDERFFTDPLPTLQRPGDRLLRERRPLSGGGGEEPASHQAAWIPGDCGSRGRGSRGDRP